MSKIARVCKQCGKEFFVWLYKIQEGKGTFCSRDCKIQNQTRHVSKICLVCQKSFLSKPSRNTQFCSYACQGQSRQKRVQVNCQLCNKSFHTPQFRLQNQRGKFCSRNCHNRSLQKTIEKNCQYCQKFFHVTPSVLRQGGGRCCSLPCRDALNTLNAQPIESRMEQYIDRTSSPNGCWIWTGARDSAGYGTVFLRMKQNDSKKSRKKDQDRAHRLMWIRNFGPIPEGIFVCHRCDNPPCCNPEHLFLGSPADNNLDSVIKGRKPKGERSWNARLTGSQVREIRMLRQKGHPLHFLAKQFGVKRTTISSIVHRRTWKHID